MAVNFTNDLACVLAEEVYKGEERLYGDVGGCGRGANDVEVAWGEITEVLNARYVFFLKNFKGC